MPTENLNTDAERAEFEAAFESMFFSSCFEREADGSYAGRGLQGAWLGWQKARAAQPAPVVPEGYAVVPVEPTPAMLDVAVSHALMVSLSGDYNWSAYMRDVWLRMVAAAAPAQGQQVECQECERLRSEIEVVTAQRDAAQTIIGGLQVIIDDQCDELSALKAQQVGQHPDDAAVDRFAAAMKAKLARSREKGRHGWQNCTAPHLSAMLYDHLYKADPLDVGNFAMMLHQNGQAIELPFEARRKRVAPQPAPAQDVAEDWSVFIGYLIDKCEGHEISEERLQFWLRDMLDDPHYGALFRREKELAEQPSAIALSIEAAEEEHGSLRAAAKALDVDHGYLSRLKNGDKSNPSDELLAKLGLERLVIYRTAAHDKQSGGEV